MIFTDKIISVPAPQEEQDSEEDVSQCPCQIKYKIKGTQLTILTRSDLDHTTEIRQQGLPVAQASVVQEMATAMPTGFNCLIAYFNSIFDIFLGL